MDTVHKDNIWSSIGNEMNLTGKICKNCWNNIRDNYRKSIKKTTSGQAFKKNKKYKYDDQLQFLKLHLQERDTLRNLKDVNDDDLKNSSNDSEDDVENVSTVQNIEINISGNTDGEDQLPKTSEYQSAVRKCTKKRTTKTPESASSTLMKYIIQKRENDIANTTQTHSVDAFLAGLSPTLKSFTPYYLNIVKSKIFSIVQEYEMQMIVDEEKKKTTFMTPYPTHFLPPQQQFGRAFPSSSAQHLNHNTYPSTQLQKEMPSPSVSNYSSSPPSQQVSHVASVSNTKNIIELPHDISSPTTSDYSSTPSPQFVHQFVSNNSQNSTNVPVLNDTLTPTSTQYSSPPQSPFFNKNIGSYMSITQNRTHLQRTQDMLIPTLSSSRPQFDQTISNQTSIQPQQEIYSNLPANVYVPQSNNKFKHPKTKPYKNPEENESAAKYFAHFSNKDNIQ
ncbi:uncharacterized protein LOC107884027 [Acyrthosiphon pisum]|uniref:MADF domain-containing protein n=1 Tax=Acyrthosiphon pisum TaxID=7029 RepID=A0A8R2H927_ACYPI|nr:uncharacterized protein LOC107884027 [Acyrthosiphon pisum]|eukprot:XP_016660817.1 PREDICTED: uncharacterized protein LOC107884027 [Acyrthosiphon pisum]